jgi:hypothetical protein
MQSLLLCVYESPFINFQMPKPIFIKLGMNIMTPDTFSAVYFIILSIGLCDYILTLHVVAR